MKSPTRPHPTTAAPAALIPAPPRWWGGRKRPPQPAAPSQREVWTPEARALHQRPPNTRRHSTGLLPRTTFFQCLDTAIRWAEREGRELSVVVLQVPTIPAPEERRRRELEIALRLGVRSEDLPARLSETVLVVALPDTGENSLRVANRLQQSLSKSTGGPVGAGVASYPEDGRTAMELLRTAAQRGQLACAGQAPDPELKLLLGPLDEAP